MLHKTSLAVSMRQYQIKLLGIMAMDANFASGQKKPISSLCGRL